MSCADRAMLPDDAAAAGRSGRRALRLALAGAILCLAGAAGAATTDLSTLVVVPQRGQSAEQARRDRFECHNWAVEQTGAAPVRAADGRDGKRARRLEKVALGAAIGAAVGGIVGSDHGRDHGRYRRHDDDTAEAALGGAVVGAAAGALAGRRDRSPDQNADYIRALSACLEGRGYSVDTGAADDEED